MFKKVTRQAGIRCGRSERKAVTRCIFGATGTQDVEDLTGTHCLAPCNR